MNQKGIAHLFLILILLIAGVGLGVYLVQNRTNILPRAASGPIAPRTAFSFQASTNSVQVGEELDVDVIVSSDFDEANTFSAKIVYDPSKLEVSKISPDIADTASGSGYFIKKWIEQTDDKNGNLLLAGSVPNPGFKTTPGNPGKMVTITLRAKTTGSAAIGYDFASSAIYRNSDNQNILGSTDAWGINITPVGSGSAQPGKLSLVPSTQSVAQGCSISIDIMLETNGRNTDGTDVILKYDPEKVSVNNFYKGNLYPEYLDNIDNTQGTFSLSGISSVETPFNGKGIFATVVFKFNPNLGPGGTADIKFDFDPANTGKTTDTNIVERVTANELLGSVVDGSYTVTSSLAACAAPSPSPTPSGTPYPAQTVDLKPASGRFTPTNFGTTKVDVLGFDGITLSVKLSGQLSGLKPNTVYKVYMCRIDSYLSCGTNALPEIKTDASGSVTYSTNQFSMNDTSRKHSYFVKVVEEPAPGPVPSDACLNSNPCMEGIYNLFSPTPSPSATPVPVDGKRADLYNDPKKPNFINDQDISVFFSKCADKGVELFGQPASVQPICDIFEDGKITVQDWSVLIKFRNQSV